MAKWIEPEIVNAVSEQIGNAWELVTTAFDQGINALNALGGQSYELAWEPVEVESLEAPSFGVSVPASPDTPYIPIPSVSFDGKEITTEDVDLVSPTIPSFVDSDYNFSVPSAPNVNWPGFSKTAPGVSDISLPNPPSFSLPEVPVINMLEIPPPPEYNTNTFEGVLPVDDLTFPVLSFNWGESNYDSNLKTKLGDWIYDKLVLGATGLDEATEQAIYDRARSRMEDEEQSLLDSINDNMASRGFPLPSGAYASQVLSAENKILRTREDLNKDILIQQSELAQKNMQFVVEKAVQLENVLIDYHNQVQNRAMDAAKFVVTTAMQNYNLKVEAYKAKLAAYTAMAQVYQVQIQGEIAKAEFYKTQIEGMKVSAEVQNSYIEAYKAQIAGIGALIEVYKAQMEGANIQANVDKVRMEGFLHEVQAYSARVNAEALKYEGYKSQVAGESLKIEMRKANTDTYGAQLNAAKIISDVQLATQQAKLVKTQADVEIFKGQVQKYAGDVQAAVLAAETRAKQEGLRVELYKVKGGMYATEIDAAMKGYLGKVEEMKNRTAASIRESEVALQSLTSQYTLAAENLRAIAQVAGQMSAAAASSVNASFSASHGNSNSASNSYQRSESESDSKNTSYSVVEQTIHQYSN